MPVNTLNGNTIPPLVDQATVEVNDHDVTEQDNLTSPSGALIIESPVTDLEENASVTPTEQPTVTVNP